MPSWGAIMAGRAPGHTLRRRGGASVPPQLTGPVTGVPVFTHGLGGSQDLPIPLSLALAGGAAALAVSFIVLALAWKTPRFDADVQGRPVPGLQLVVDAPAFQWALRLFGLAATAYVGWAALEIG